MMSLAEKVSEFSSCYHKLHRIYIRSIELPEDFDKIKNGSFLAMVYFTAFVHERQGTNPDFQKFHRIAIRKRLKENNFASELLNKDSNLPDSV